MTLASTTSKLLYNGDGSTAVFAVSFVFWRNSDIKVVHRDANGAETSWVEGVHCALSGGGGDTGTLTVKTTPTDHTPATGEKLLIKSALPETQGASLPLGGAFPSTTVERMADFLTRLIQQHSEEIARSFQAAETDDDAGALPTSPERAGKYLAFDAQGNAIASAGPAGEVAVSPFGATLVDDADAAAALTTLGVDSAKAQALGTAATKDTGVGNGQVPVMDAAGYPAADGSRITGVIPVGVMQMWAYSTAPSKWYFCDGSEKSCTTLESLFDVALADIAAWGRGTVVGTFTADAGTDTITQTGHGFSDNDAIYFTNSGGALPGGTSPDTKYFVINSTANTYQISTNSGGSAINITDAGTGTHSSYSTFKLPDARGKSPLGVNDSGLPAGADGTYTTRNEGDVGGEESHTLTVSEMPSHTHTYSVHYTSQLGTSLDAGGNQSSGSGNRVTDGSGSDMAHNTMHPFFTVNFIIYAGA